MTKFIFVTGGVVSSLGKGITAASLGVLLKKRGFRVSVIKMDPYINVDAGTMNPFQHGEVFVTDDGAETDLDLGHYERFIDLRLGKGNSVTSGKIYSSVISKERRGEYKGGTVQVIPHVTNEIQDSILRIADDNDVVISEIGGTVGDIEGLPYLEAIRQISLRVGRENVLYCHVTLVPYIAAAKELKTKPTQHSVNELRRIGIQPDVIVCRSQYALGNDLRDKIALFCSVPKDCVIEEVDASSIYEVPLDLRNQGFDSLVMRKLQLESRPEPDLGDWEEFMRNLENPQGKVCIALVGKYISLKDAYLSVTEALTHAGVSNRVCVELLPVEGEALEKKGFERASETLGCANGILVPGGFGERGVEGKILAARYARENRIPYLGLCLGLQVSVIEFARNRLGLAAAHSVEFDPGTPNPVIHLMEEQLNVEHMGASSRLGAFPCKVKPGTLVAAAYNEERILERHRHRYEFNNHYRARFEENGFRVSGIYEEKGLVECMELADHPWFVGVQFHPEFLSRPVRAHPLFRDFVAAAAADARART